MIRAKKSKSACWRRTLFLIVDLMGIIYKILLMLNVKRKVVPDMANALLVIDMLNDFLEKDGALSIGDDAEQVIEKVSSRIKEYRSAGSPVIYMMDKHLPQDAEFKMFPPHCLAGERGGAIVEDLAPEKGDYLIYKRRYSGFFGTDLDLTLRELGVTQLELAGVCTQICILYTAADARMFNYEVMVRKDCVASFDGEAHEFALKEMEKTLGVKVL